VSLLVKEARDVGARVYHSSGQTIPNNSHTACAFDSESYDTDGIHDPVTNNTRLTCKTPGKYLITGCVAWDANGPGYRHIHIRKNGGGSYAGVTIGGFTGAWNYVVVTSLLDLVVDDYVELILYQTSGGNLDVKSSGEQNPSFMMQKVG